MKLNKPLLRKLALKLRRLRHEEHYNQTETFRKNSCGTTACLGGWALVLGGVPLKPLLNEWGELPARKLEIARRLLGLPVRGLAAVCPGRHWLFSGAPDPRHEIYQDTAWPDEYRRRWRAAVDGQSKERPSRIAADLLDAIASGTVKP